MEAELRKKDAAGGVGGQLVAHHCQFRQQEGTAMGLVFFKERPVLVAVAFDGNLLLYIYHRE